MGGGSLVDPSSCALGPNLMAQTCSMNPAQKDAENEEEGILGGMKEAWRPGLARGQ